MNPQNNHVLSSQGHFTTGNEHPRSTTLGAELKRERDKGDGDWYRFGDEVVFAAGEFGWVFDRAEFEAALEARLVISPADYVDTVQMLEERCNDISSTERGRRALRLFEQESELRLKTE